MPMDDDLAHIVRVSRAARDAGDFGVLSTGEKLAAALVLNRADWLKKIDYTMCEAIDRLDGNGNWLKHLRAAERILKDDENGLTCADQRP